MSAMLATHTWDRLDYAAGLAKFAPPALPRHWIRRDRLHRQLSVALQQRLTVVTAPPGAGKTAVLSDWAKACSTHDVAWLTVDDEDNLADVFWRDVAAALGIDRGGPRDDDNPSVANTRWVDWVLHQMNTKRSCLLVLDDFHLISDLDIIDSVALLSRRLPDHVRLVLAGNAIPALPIRWLLLSGQAAAVTEADLRFTVEESAALVAMAAGKFLPVDQLTTLADRSQGWAAGVYLAATALVDEPDPSECMRRFSGAFGPIAEYLEHELLLSEPYDVVQFLLQTSILDRLTPDVCRAVTGRDDAADLLEALAGRNLFVVPVETEPRTYRYHRLLAELLSSRLQLEDPSLAREAHFNAGSWFEQSGDARAAAHHFAQAQAYDRAFVLAFSDLLHPIDGDGFPAGDATLVPIGGPGADLDEDPGRTYIYAAALLCSQRIAEAAQLLRRLDAITADESDRRLWRGRVEFLWAVHAERLADAASVLDHCRTMSELMGPPAEPAGRESHPGPAGTDRQPAEPFEWWSDTIDAAIADHVPILAARAHVWLDQPDQAQAILVNRFGSEEAAEVSQPATLALMACRQGRLRSGYEFATSALQRAEVSGRSEDLVTLDARLALADVLFEQNDLEGAQAHLESARRLCRTVGGTHWEWAVEVDLVRLLIAKQRPGDALNRLGHLRHLEGRQPPPHHLLQKLNYVEILCRIALGDLEGTLLVARSMAPPDIARETLARIDLFSGRPDRALSRLAAGPLPKLGAEIRRLILLACAEMQRGRTQLAEDAIGRALDTGRPDGYVRPFLEEAPQIISLLRGTLSTRPDLYVTHLVCQAEQVVPLTSAEPSGQVLEPLTDRERELLSYLPSHLHLREIASSMYVSLNTVKTHLKNIYRKLGVASRSEAVAMARAHGLL
jgi:LuxR family transcriptional regulator, maltose regulon positive regulatory protein